MKTLLLVCFLSLVLETSCSNFPVHKVPTIESILTDNPELKIVLEKYRNDSLKYKAAVFLISNLPFHFGYEGEALDNYYKLYELHGKGTLYPEMVLDSISKSNGSFRLETLIKKEDINIKPEYLIENIEWAFKVWKEQPWGKNISFDNFCEFVLPYRVADEKLLSWREGIYRKYNPLLDSIRCLPEAYERFIV